MKKFLASLFLLAASIVGANAQTTCNPPVQWIESYGPFQLGSIAVFGPDCNHIIGGALTRTLQLGPAVYYVDNGGNDSNNGLTPATAFATINHCVQVIFNTIDNQGFIPECRMTGGQTFTESLTVQGQPTGVNCIKLSGNSGTFTWRPQAGLSFIVEPSDFSCIIFTLVGFDTTGGANPTNAVFCHQKNILDLNQTTFNGTHAGDQYLFTDADCRANVAAGLTLGGTAANIFSLGPLANLQFSQGVTTTGTPTFSQFIFMTQNSSAVFQGNFAVTGVYGAMRQYAVLNGAQLCNAGATIPGGTSGITTAAGSSNGFFSTANCGD